MHVLALQWPAETLMLMAATRFEQHHRSKLLIRRRRNRYARFDRTVTAGSDLVVPKRMSAVADNLK